MSTPLLIVGLLSAFYSINSIIAFNKSRTQFNEFLSNHSNLNSSRYLRLMCLAGLEVLGTIPFTIAGMVMNRQGNAFQQWISWANTHSHFDRVDQFPSILWRSNPVGANQLELCRWMTVVCAFVFFGFFGFADEARLHYRLAIHSITKTLGISSLTLTGSSGGVLSSEVAFKSKTGSAGKLRPGIPVHVHKEMYDSRGSMVSIGSLKDIAGFLSEKRDDERASSFAPTLSYGAMTLNDVGGTIADCTTSPVSSVPSSGPTSTLSSTPAVTRQNSIGNIEISSLRRDSTAPTSPVVVVVDTATAEKAHTHDVV
jgi:pheromone a factor receptor